MEALAARDTPVRHMAAATLDKLVAQARLQHARKDGGPSFELRAPSPGKGFDLLPQPQPGDVFYDIEGDPYYEGGLEYLHGLWADGAFTGLLGPRSRTGGAGALGSLRLVPRPHWRPSRRPASITTPPTR